MDDDDDDDDNDDDNDNDDGADGDDVDGDDINDDDDDEDAGGSDADDDEQANDDVWTGRVHWSDRPGEISQLQERDQGRSKSGIDRAISSILLMTIITVRKSIILRKNENTDYFLNCSKENSTLNGSPSVGCWPQGEESSPTRKMHKVGKYRFFIDSFSS